jgi:hypothetical protein
VRIHLALREFFEALEQEDGRKEKEQKKIERAYSLDKPSKIKYKLQWEAMPFHVNGRLIRSH